MDGRQIADFVMAKYPLVLRRLGGEGWDDIHREMLARPSLNGKRHVLDRERWGAVDIGDGGSGG